MNQRPSAKPIAIAADHRGVPLKEHLKRWLEAHRYGVSDLGTNSATNRVDAMDYALVLVAEVKHGRSDFAVGICGSGQMMAITANRFPFMRATLLHTASEAALARQHADANMLAIGADTIEATAAEQLLGTFLTTAALGDRYAARRARLAELDISKL
ncbi:MAG: RpiB/LacA/LacB family sugar-phosphate isomerase [Alphaproteobacteria bacterium]|nr:RpiB/LacA/LacB family sugar-phosphate isomerase [Alphaproteobacteria bacterium]